MKVSELIEELQSQLEVIGDKEVVLWRGDHFNRSYMTRLDDCDLSLIEIESLEVGIYTYSK